MDLLPVRLIRFQRLDHRHPCLHLIYKMGPSGHKHSCTLSYTSLYNDPALLLDALDLHWSCTKYLYG
jgi:hypothetical protein